MTEISTWLQDEDWGPRIQDAAERHLNAVYEAEERAENGEDVNSPAAGPWCGCETCMVREVLAGAWPTIETYFALRTTTFTTAGQQ